MVQPILQTSKIKVVKKKLGRNKAWGLAYKEKGEVHIDERLKGKDLLDTLIHELIHILQPDLIEEKVEFLGTQLAEHLWDQGYRKVET